MVVSQCSDYVEAESDSRSSGAGGARGTGVGSTLRSKPINCKSCYCLARPRHKGAITYLLKASKQSQIQTGMLIEALARCQYRDNGCPLWSQEAERPSSGHNMVLFNSATSALLTCSSTPLRESWMRNVSIPRSLRTVEASRQTLPLSDESNKPIAKCCCFLVGQTLDGPSLRTKTAASAGAQVYSRRGRSDPDAADGASYVLHLFVAANAASWTSRPIISSRLVRSLSPLVQPCPVVDWRAGHGQVVVVRHLSAGTGRLHQGE
jgi:hypothetical protein